MEKNVFNEKNGDYGLTFSVVNGEAAVTGCTGEPENIDIPEFFGCYPVTELRDNAFYNNDSLKEVNVSGNVSSIGHHCFYACTALERVKLTTGLVSIGEGCFCGCDSLTDIAIPDTVRELPDSCFRACGNLSGITLPNSLRSIGDLCFSGCEQLKSVKTGGELAEIGCGAFYMCPKLMSIRIPSACKSIGDQALGYGCRGNEPVRNERLTILGVSGSAAEEYASENGIGFAEFSETAGTVGSAPWITAKNTAPLWTGAAVFTVLAVTLIRCFILHKDG